MTLLDKNLVTVDGHQCRVYFEPVTAAKPTWPHQAGYGFFHVQVVLMVIGADENGVDRIESEFSEWEHFVSTSDVGQLDETIRQLGRQTIQAYRESRRLVGQNQTTSV